VLGAAGVVASVLSDLGGSRWAVLGGGVVLALLGLALLTPIASRVLLPVLGRLLGWSMPTKLGRRNAERNPRRTAITVATLVVTLGLVGGVAVVAESLRADVTTRVGSDLAADFVISGDGVAGKAGGQGGGPPTAADGRVMPTFAPSVITRARSVDGVAAATAQYVDTARVSGVDGKAVASPANAGELSSLSEVLGLVRVSGQLRDLRPGEVVVDSATLEARGLQVGGPVRLATQRGGWRTYEIVGSYEPNLLLSGPVLAPADAATAFVSTQPAMGYVKLREGADVAAAKRSLTELVADNPEVTVADQTQTAVAASSQVDVTELMLYVLLGLSVVIGVLGIVNTMALSIVERTRELGLLRAVGMRRSHLVQMVVAESVVTAVFGGLLGLAFGGAAGAAVVAVADLASLAIPWMSLAVFLGLSVLAGLVAALAPATRAAKVNVLSAIAHE
jgi:putative ABC transport system permease protein